MPSERLLKKFEVTYSNKSGDVRPKTTIAIGPDNRSVRTRFETQGYRVASVIERGLADGSIRTD